jgi:Uma2 family endonuclease
MATRRTTGLTYDDFARLPETNRIEELIDGELVVTPTSTTGHQDAVLTLGTELNLYARRHGGRVFVSPTGVYLSHTNVLEPDVLFVRPEHAGRVEGPFVRGAPDLVVEVSSPSTRRRDLGRKRELYEEFGVPEYWFVDLEAERVEVHRLEGGRYAAPVALGPGETLESPLLPGFAVAVDDLLRPGPGPGPGGTGG